MNNRDNASGDVKKIKIKSVFGSKRELCDVIVTVIAFNYFDFYSTITLCCLLFLCCVFILKSIT